MSGGSAQTSRRPWYDVAFQADYLARYARHSDAVATADAPFLARMLALPRGARVLDLCCGAGRHARALSRLGLWVVGVDRSAPLLQAGLTHAKSRRRAQYVRGDMRRLPLRTESLDGAINLFTSFGYFPRGAEDLRVLREVRRVLKPGARLVFDFFNFTHTLRNLVAQSERRLAGHKLTEQRHYDRRRRRLVKVVSFDGGAGTPRKESVRAYTPAELARLFRRAGLKLIARLGDLRGAPFSSANSPRCVLVACKPARSRRRAAG